jgi:class 3 adenylate cyclase
MERPDVKYAVTADGTHVAYAVMGNGPIDLVYSYGYLSNIDTFAEWPENAAFWKRLAAFSRLIIFDRRGSGLSDRGLSEGANTLEAGMDDIRAVMDAAGSERALLFGLQDGGRLCALFAASHPDRTAGLVVCGFAAGGAKAEGFPWAWTDEQWDRFLESTETSWGSAGHAAEEMRWVSGGRPLTAEQIEVYARMFRSTASPGSALVVQRMERDSDIRSVLPALRVPTLVLHAIDDQVEPVEMGRFVASKIPGARMVELPGSEHLPLWDMAGPVVEEVRSFAASIRSEEAELDRVLATVLFTDVVDSTAQSAAMGDHAWRQVMDRHDQLVRGQLARYRGQEIKTMGDGFLATFDGPARGIRCAQTIAQGVRDLGIEVRAGLHTGEVTFQVGDVAGLGVAIGARVGAKAGASEVLVSQTVKDLVAGSGLLFEDAGEHELKGVPDRWHLYRVVSP